MKFYYKFLLAFFLTSSTCCFAKEKNFSDTQEWGKDELFFLKSWKPKYVKSDSKEFQAKKYMFPSAEKEVVYLLDLQNNRTQKQMDVIEREKHVCGFHMDGYHLGMNKMIDELLLDAYFDARLWGFALKKHYDRIRPSHLDVRIKPSIDNPPHAAYPSNHSFQAHVMALVLGEIYPKKKEAFWKAANGIAKNREVAGVHYPSDSEFGQILAQDIFKKLMSNKEFNGRLQKLKGYKLPLFVSAELEKVYLQCISITTKYANNNGVWPHKR